MGLHTSLAGNTPSIKRGITCCTSLVLTQCGYGTLCASFCIGHVEPQSYQQQDICMSGGNTTVPAWLQRPGATPRPVQVVTHTRTRSCSSSLLTSSPIGFFFLQLQCRQHLQTSFLAVQLVHSGGRLSFPEQSEPTWQDARRMLEQTTRRMV